MRRERFIWIGNECVERKEERGGEGEGEREGNYPCSPAVLAFQEVLNLFPDSA